MAFGNLTKNVKNKDIEEEIKLLATNIEVLNQKIGETQYKSSSQYPEEIENNEEAISQKLDRLLNYLNSPQKNADQSILSEHLNKVVNKVIKSLDESIKKGVKPDQILTILQQLTQINKKLYLENKENHRKAHEELKNDLKYEISELRNYLGQVGNAYNQELKTFKEYILTSKSLWNEITKKTNDLSEKLDKNIKSDEILQLVQKLGEINKNIYLKNKENHQSFNSKLKNEILNDLDEFKEDLKNSDQKFINKINSIFELLKKNEDEKDKVNDANFRLEKQMLDSNQKINELSEEIKNLKSIINMMVQDKPRLNSKTNKITPIYSSKEFR